MIIASNMARHLGSFMFFVRLLQSLASIIIISTNAFLISYISTRKLGLGTNMIAIEVLVRRYSPIIPGQLPFLC
jgi:hypothetical protein